MKNYQEWYRNINSRLTSHPTLLFLLRGFNQLDSRHALVYLILLVTTYLKLGLGQQVEVYVLIPASGFVILSLFSKINHHAPTGSLGYRSLLEKRIVRDSLYLSSCLFSLSSLGLFHAWTLIGMILLICSES